MFSNLGPLFKSTFRKAEQTDTRQAIQREDKKQNRKRKEKEEDHRISIDLWEDKSSVSVEALQSFLITFIKGETYIPSSRSDNESSTTEDKDTPAITKPPDRKKPQTTKQHRAISAYESMNDRIDPSPILPKEQTHIADADLIESKEARAIYKLIEDLDLLQEHGIMEIFIDPSDNFVDSLRGAVAHEMLKIKHL